MTDDEKNEKRREYMRQWLARHPDYWKLHPSSKRKYDIEKRRAAHRRYMKKNREKFREYDRKYRLEHPEKVRDWQRKYIMSHPEKRRAYQAKWRKNHPEKVLQASRDRRAMFPEMTEYYNTLVIQRMEVDAEFYARYRAARREQQARIYRKKHPNAKPYRGRPSMRIPDYMVRGQCNPALCTFAIESKSQLEAMSCIDFARGLAIERKRER